MFDAIVFVCGSPPPFAPSAPNATLGGGFTVWVGPLVDSPANPAYTLNAAAIPTYSVGTTVCMPGAPASLPPPGTPVDYATCGAGPHTDLRFQVVVAVVHVHTPPVFSAPNVTFHTPGVPSWGALVGFPLVSITTDPDYAPPYNTFSFRSVHTACVVCCVSLCVCCARLCSCVCVRVCACVCA